MPRSRRAVIVMPGQGAHPADGERLGMKKITVRKSGAIKLAPLSTSPTVYGPFWPIC
jgi:hypothetical protein